MVTLNTIKTMVFSVPISKSQIVSKLKSNGITCFPLDNKTYYIPTKDIKTTLQRVYGLLMTDGASVDQRSKYSVYGAIQVGGYNLVATRERYVPTKVGQLGSAPNQEVKNRLVFGSMIHDVLAHNIKPLTVVLDAGKKVTIRNVTNAKFLGEGVGDFYLMQVNKKIPISVMGTKGVYRTDIHEPYLDIAHEALEVAATNGELLAEMNGNRMTLHSSVATEADLSTIRNLMFRDIHNGVGVVGDFKPSDFVYNGKTNTLTIKCYRAYTTQTDLKTEDKPYLVVTNSKRKGKIGELEGLQVDLVPKRNLPNQVTFVDL